MGNLRKKIISLLLSVTMCVSLMPAMAFAEAEEEDSITYVALGDSMAQGYMFLDYTENSNEGHYCGWEGSSSYGYIKQFASELAKDVNRKVNLIDLSLQGEQPDEVIAFLEEYSVDQINKMTLGARKHIGWWVGDYEPNGKKESNVFVFPTFQKMSQYFIDSIKAADIITYDIGMNYLGTYLLDERGEGETYASIKSKLTKSQQNVIDNMVEEVLGEAIDSAIFDLITYFIDVDDIIESNDTFKVLMDGVKYACASYLLYTEQCLNDIFKLNPDVRVILVPLANTNRDVSSTYYLSVEGLFSEEVGIDCDKAMDTLMTLLNNYIKNTYIKNSPYKNQMTFATLNGEVVSFADELYMYKNDLSDDLKALIARLGTEMGVPSPYLPAWEALCIKAATVRMIPMETLMGLLGGATPSISGERMQIILADPNQATNDELTAIYLAVRLGNTARGFGSHPCPRGLEVKHKAVLAAFKNIRTNFLKLNSIQLTAPTKTNYVKGQDLVLTGMSLTATYSDGSTQTITTGYTISGYNKDTLGDQTVEVSYGGKTATFKVTVEEKAVSKIEISTSPTKLKYIAGQELDLTDMVVTATYNDGEEKAVTGYTVSGYNKDTIGEQTITVTFDKKTTTFKVTVEEKAVSEIAITTAPKKLTYVQGQDLVLTDMVVTATYNDGDKKAVTGYEISGYNKDKTGDQTITVTFDKKTTTFKVTVEEKAVSEIAITTAPKKLTYVQGQDLVLTDMVVTATYNDGEEKAVTGYTVSGYNKDTLGDQTVTVTYDKKTTTFKVTVEAKVVSEIEITTLPKKLTYVEGQDLVLTDMVVTATYNDGDKKAVTGYTVSGYNPNKAEEQTVTITYNGKTSTFKVTVEAKVVSKIEITTAPKKLTYIEGQDLVLTDMVVTATYNDGEESAIIGYEISGYDKDEIGEQTVTIEFGKKTTSFKVTVERKSLSSISVTKKPNKVEYLENKEELDLEGGQVTKTYNNGSTEVVKLTQDMVTGFDNSTAGKKTLTVKIDGKETTFDVTITLKSLLSIAITTAPTKLAYIAGQELDLKDMVVTASYNNDSKDVITNYDVSGYNKDEIGEQTVTITYNGKTATFKVTVEAKVVSKIEITTAPKKLTYIEGQDLVLTDMVVTATYNDGDKKAVTGYGISGYDKDTLGEQTVTVTFDKKTATFKVTVVLKKLETIAMDSLPKKINYARITDELDLFGAAIKLTYDNGTYEIIDVTEDMVSGFDNTKEGKNTITVTYMDKKTSFEVNVSDYIKGDFTGDDEVTDKDAIYLLYHTLFPSDYPIAQSGDVNKDGKVDDKDAIYLLYHTLFKDDYPLN